MIDDLQGWCFYSHITAYQASDISRQVSQVGAVPELVPVRAAHRLLALTFDDEDTL